MTLYDSCDNILTEEVDAAEEIDHVNHALGAFSYLSWSFRRVREQMDQREQKNTWKINTNDRKEKMGRSESPCLMSGGFQRP